MDVGVYMSNKDSNGIVIYIKGIGDGYLFANAYLENKSMKKMYCQPRALSLNGYNYKQIIDEELNLHKYPQDMPLALVLQEGLIRTFSCK